MYLLTPAQEYEELRQHHRRRAPDFDAVDKKRRSSHAAASEAQRSRRPAVRIHQPIDWDFEDAGDFAFRGPKLGSVGGGAHNRVETEAAHRDVERRQRAKGSDASEVQSDFLVSFAKSGVLEAFSRLDDAARQRNLAAVSAKRVGANGENHVGVSVSREQQEKACRVPKVCRLEPSRPLARRLWRHECVGGRAWQRLSQRRFERSDGGVVDQGASVICAQLRGADRYIQTGPAGRSPPSPSLSLPVASKEAACTAAASAIRNFGDGHDMLKKTQRERQIDLSVLTRMT